MIRYFTDSSNTETEYTYAVGRIRELEKKLLNKVLLDKLIESSDLSSSINLLIESGLDSYSFDIYNHVDFENSLNKELIRTYKVIKDISPYPFIYYVFALNYDFHNLKVLIKSKYLKKKYTESLSEIGTINIKNLIMAIEEEKFTEIPVSFESAVRKTISEYNKFQDPEIIDLVLDKERYNIISNILKDIEAPFLKKFVKMNIDLNNIITTIRIKIRGEDKVFLKKFLIDKGNLDLKNLIDIFDSPLSSWSAKFAKTDYEKIVEMGLKSYEIKGSLIEIERLIDNFILNFVKIGRFITFGMEPLVGFIVAKENDVKNIRIILSGKLNKLSPAEIKERIRDVYV
ncbi:MAG: V-type ATP synthase subunit C [Atribacterota bacterium]